MAGGHNDDAVAHLDFIITGRDQGPAAAQDAGNEDAGLQTHFLEGHACHLKIGLHAEFQGLCLAVHELVEGFHVAAQGVFQRARITGEHVGGDVLGGNQALQTQLFGDEFQFIAVDLGDDLRHALAGGIEGDEDVFLIHAGEGCEGVHGFQAFLQQDFLLRAVAADDHRTGQLFADLLALLAVLVDDLDAGAAGQQHLGKVKAHAAGAEDHNAPGLLLHQAHHAQELLDFRGRCGKFNAVAAFQSEGAVRDADIVAALHRTDQEFGLLVLLAQLHQLHAAQGGILAHDQLHHFKVAAGEILDLDRAGKLEHMVEFLCSD